MATLYIAEFTTLMPTPGGTGQAPGTPPQAEQTVAIDVASAQSAAFNSATKVVRLNCDAACSVAWGRNPTATASNMRLSAGQTEYFSVSGGDKVAVITNT